MPPRLPSLPSGPAPRRSFLEDVLAGGSRPAAGGLGRLGAAQQEQRPEPGTPEDVLRRATTAFENKQTQAEALGVSETGEGPRGFLEAIAGPLSVLDMPRSAVFSTLSGNPTRIGEHRGFGDTGLLKVHADDSMLEKGVKGAAAFVGDVATDPLTYVSFGLGPIGKKALSRVLGNQARRIAVDLSDEAIEAWGQRATRFRGGQKVREVAEQAGDDTARAFADQYDEILTEPPSTWTGTADEWRSHLGREEFAGAVVESYQRGGSTGLRRFLRDELGEEAGEAAFESLPLDLKGGPRVRVPFAKDERGLPKTLPMTGDESLQGGGRLTETLFGEGSSAKLEEIHRLRNRARASRLGSLVADRFTGDGQGRLYGQMVRDLYRQTDDDGLDRVTWRAYEAIVDADETAKATTRRLRNEAAMVLGRVEQLLEGAGDEAAQAQARKLFVERFNDPARSRQLAAAGEWQARTGEPIRFEGSAVDPEQVAWYEGLDDVERRAVTAALDVQQHFERQLRDLRAAGMDVNEVRDYVARIMTDGEKLARERRKPVRRSQQQGGRQGSTDPTGERKRWVDGDLVAGPDGELHLELRWRTPEEINELEGRQVFETDPTQVVAKYADAVSNATAKVQFANLVNEAGVTVPGGVAIRRSVQEARVGQVGRAVEEQARVALDEVGRARETLERDLADARAAEAAAKAGQRAARETAAADDAVAAAAGRVAADPAPGILPELEDGWARLWRADGGDWSDVRPDGDVVEYLDVPERVASGPVPDDLAVLARRAPSGDVDPLLARPRDVVVDEAGDQAVEAAEAELRRVAAEERLAQFESRQADRSELAEDRDVREGVGEFVFQGAERFRTPVVSGLFGPAGGEIELPNASLLDADAAAELDSVTSALHAAGFEQVAIRTREPSSYERYLESVNQMEEEYLVDVWAPVDDGALEDLRRVFVEQVDAHLPEGWEAQAYERFGRRAIGDGEVRPSMTTGQVAAEVADPASEGDRAFAATGVTLDGPAEDVAVAIRFLMDADAAGFDVRLEGFASPVAHTTDTAAAGGARRKGDKVVGISRGVQLQARAWAVLGGTADAKRELARRFADAGVDVGTEALSLRKAGKAERVVLARVQGRDLAAERATFDEWMQARRAEYADDPMVEGEQLEVASQAVNERRAAEGGRAAKKQATYAHGEQHAAPDFETWLEARHPEGTRPPEPDEAGWPDTIDGLADLYGKLRADGGKDAAKLADKVASALDDAGWQLRQVDAQAATGTAPRGPRHEWWGDTRPSERPWEGIQAAGERAVSAVEASADVARRMLGRARGPDLPELRRLADGGLPTELREALEAGDETASRALLREYEDARALAEGLERQPYARRDVTVRSDDPVEEHLLKWVRGEGVPLLRDAFRDGAIDPDLGRTVGLLRETMGRAEPLSYPLHRIVRDSQRTPGWAVDWSSVRPGQTVDLPLTSWTDNPDLATLRDWRNAAAWELEVRGARAADLSRLVDGLDAQGEFILAGRLRVAEVDGNRIVLEQVDTPAPTQAAGTPIPARGVGYAIFEADDLYPHAGKDVEFVTGGRTEVRRLERAQRGGVRLVDPSGEKPPLRLEPEVAEDATTLSVFDDDGVVELPVEGTEIRPLETVEAPQAPQAYQAVRADAGGGPPLSRVFGEGRTSRLDLDDEGTLAPPTVDDVTLDPDDARALRNEARADVRGRYDDASRRALEEGRLLPDDVEQSLNRNVVRQVEAGARRRGRQAARVADRSRRSALRTRGTANRQADRASGRADALDAQLVMLNRTIDEVAVDRDRLLSTVETILKATPDVDQQQAAIEVLMEGLLDFHDRMSQTHQQVLRAARDVDERRLAKARRTYTRRLARQATREGDEALRTQPVIDLGGELMSDAGLQQIGQQKPLSGAPTTEGLASLPPELDVTWAPEQVRLGVERFYQARIGDADVKRWVDAVYRPWFALFKAWATVGRGPGYHVRNLTGAHLNNWIAGVTAADHSLSGALVNARRQAAKEVQDEAAEQMAARLGIDVEEARQRVTPQVFEAEIEAKLSERLGQIEVVDGLTLYDVHRMSVARGVGDANRVLEGLSDALGEQSARDFVAGRTRANVFPQPRPELNRVQRGVNATIDNRWIRTSSGWGQLSEEYVRNAAFIQGIRRYGSFDGGRSAKMLSDGLHFDYQALTREERFLRSTLIPFYVWIRRNTPLQFRALFMTPGKYRMVVNANEGARHAFEDDEQDVVPEWMRETLGWGSTITYGGNPIAFGVESPAIDLNRLLKVPDSLAPSDVAEAAGAVGKELVGAVSPAVKAPIEQIMGVDSFTGAQFNPNGVPAPWWYRALPDVVAPTRRDEQGQVRGSDARISALQDALPFLGLSDRAVPLTPQQRERAATNWLSLLAPVVRASTLNPRQVAGELRSRTERIDEAIKWGPGADGELLAKVADLLEDGWTADQIREAIADGRL